MMSLERMWYGRHPVRWILSPLAYAYQLLMFFRRWYLTQYRQQLAPVPVIVVGNLTVGGVGKTPLVIALVRYFQQQGLRVGVVSRGYGARIRQPLHDVLVSDTADYVGDEPLLLARKTGAPVVIARKRPLAVQYLLDHYQSQIIISDDGLQHERMGRAVEIVVIDGMRGLGNGLCLPAGPLREGLSRLKSVDFVVVNADDAHESAVSYREDAFRMQMQPATMLQPLMMGYEAVSYNDIPQPVAALVGIGHPQRFFNTLDALQLSYRPYIFPDHHRFCEQDVQVDEAWIVMTEKDAVKCEAWATPHMYAVLIEAKLDAAFWQALHQHPRLRDVMQQARSE